MRIWSRKVVQKWAPNFLVVLNPRPYTSLAVPFFGFSEPVLAETRHALLYRGTSLIKNSPPF
jgi:hypothetical protein